MTRNFDVRPDRRAGPLLASTLVMLLGAVGASAVIAGSGGDPYIGLLIFLGVIGAALIFGYVMRSTPSTTLTSRFGWLASKDARPADDYLPRAMRIKRSYGTNHPPTVEEVKDLKGSVNNWVPAKGASSGRAPRSGK
ncbi:hypothetical protein [Planctomicrobium piriforme]|uniref:Uncharacterized protein n=1 Tax=Planctomicrobium piriforme TaxID=1576369 RepID=A0A1I3KVS5_9PLAN|nr:hypothetical protein [Planctomicrobium piriforme]SFI76205.1 hypothetical protein SAMN05421753_11250 [Planctomicrobium piriforme]